MNFVSCNLTTCPLNEQRQCRSPFLMVDLDGKCVIPATGTHDTKSPIENYVEVKECNCKRCDYWVRNEVSGLGQCGNTEPLHFNLRNQDLAVCNTYENQIEEPTFGATIPEGLDRSKKRPQSDNDFLVDLR